MILDDEFLRPYPHAKPGRYVLFSVTDSGTGMEKETVKHIFEPFFTTKESDKGTGLGLAVVYGIVEQHGGRIICDSEPSVGTTFSIYFPAIEEVPQEQYSEKKEPLRGQGETILVVDDEPSFLEIVSRQLTGYNYNIITASNGKESLSLYEKHHEEIKLIILDLMMPKMGGEECLQTLLRMDPKVRVLMISGTLKPGMAEDLKEAGAKGFIKKPFDLNRMLEKIRKVVDED
jgi:CheY-like chemotaxis protein